MAVELLMLQRQLVRRLQKVVKEWPVDPSRKGRDLGEFLRLRYQQIFKEECSRDVSEFAVGGVWGGAPIPICYSI